MPSMRNYCMDVSMILVVFCYVMVNLLLLCNLRKKITFVSCVMPNLHVLALSYKYCVSPINTLV